MSECAAPVFDCANTLAAPVTAGVNTVDLAFSATPVADVIALAATASNDGTVHIANGSGAFAVAGILLIVGAALLVFMARKPIDQPST